MYGFDSLPVLSLDSCCWSMRSCRRDPQYGFPAARRCHSLVQLDRSAYICGGYDGYTIFSDLWMIDLISMQWTHLPASLPEPGVYFHSAAVTADGLMVVHGGVVQIDTRRSHRVFAVWLRLPSLRLLCWQKLIETQSCMLHRSRQCLLQAGIPPDLVDTISTST